MFEKYTEKARRVIFFARYEASQMGSPAIGVEHILLGIFREDKNLVGRFFPDPASVYASIREEIEQSHRDTEKAPVSIDLPLSAEAKRALQHAAETSSNLSQTYIGPEHLLLGILKEENSTASNLLRDRFGLNADLLTTYIQGDESTQGAENGTPDFSKKQLLGRFDALVNMLIDNGHATPKDLIDRIAGEHVMKPYVELRFQALLDLLIEKDVISEEEKREILWPQN